MDYIHAICGDSFVELHGDRGFKDDKAMVGGLGKIGDQSLYVYRATKGIQHQNTPITETLGWPTQRATEKHYA